MFHPNLFLAGVTASLFALTLPAAAITVDPANVSGFVQVGDSTGTNHVDYSGSAASYIGSQTYTFGSASETVSIGLQPSPSLSVTATASGSAAALAQNPLTLRYFFAVVGPSSERVPVIITASGGVSNVSGAPQAFENAAFLVGGSQVASTGCQCSTDAHDATFNYSGTFQIESDTNSESHAGNEVVLALTVLLLASKDTPNPTAFVDPIITIDPTFVDAALFHLEFSPGVGDSLPATPLPAGLPLFATGLGALGVVGWRRKRKAQTVA